MVKCFIYPGYVECHVPSNQEGKCSQDFTFWPFDRQTCEMQFGYANEDGPKVKLSEDAEPIEMKERSKGSAWKMIDLHQVYNQSEKLSDGQNYSTVTFKFTLQRNANVYLSRDVAAMYGTQYFSLKSIPSIHFYSSIFPVLIVFNLFSLWIDATSNMRFIILAFSLVGHWHQIEYIELRVPDTYSYVPLFGNRKIKLIA